MSSSFQHVRGPFFRFRSRVDGTDAKLYPSLNGRLGDDNLGLGDYDGPNGAGTAYGADEWRPPHLFKICDPSHLWSICAAIGEKHLQPKLWCLYRLRCVCSDFRETLTLPSTDETAKDDADYKGQVFDLLTDLEIRSQLAMHETFVALTPCLLAGVQKSCQRGR